MYAGGKHFGGRPGLPLQARHRDRYPPAQLYDPLGLLRALQGVTGARLVGNEPVRGTPCRMVAVRAGPAELTVWIDGEHVRRIRHGEHGSREDESASRIWTLELWDFGVPVGSLDWSRLPSFHTPG